MKKRILTLTAAALGVGLGVGLSANIQRNKTNAIKSLLKGSSIIETARGPIETSFQGEGPAVLMVHGALGGYDRAQVYALPDSGFKFICPSRPGYMRTPLSVGRTFEEQADALAALLDALEIEKAALVGCSAGGPVAVNFALHYPQRCWGLVMGNAIIAPLPNPHQLMVPVARITFGWDWLTWFGPQRVVAYTLWPRLGWQVAGNPAKEQQVLAMLRSMYPTSLRKEGFLNDMYQFQHTPSYPLEHISAPTLVVHGTADNVVPYWQGVNSAKRIPSAQFLSIKDGTHLCFISHYEVVQPLLLAFFNQHKPRG